MFTIFKFVFILWINSPKHLQHCEKHTYERATLRYYNIRIILLFKSRLRLSVRSCTDKVSSLMKTFREGYYGTKVQNGNFVFHLSNVMSYKLPIRTPQKSCTGSPLFFFLFI